MKKIFSSQDLVTISYYKNLLEANGMACTVKNYYLAGGVGELPINTCWPELWLLDNSCYEEALKFLDQVTAPVEQVSWICFACGELIEAQFQQCWKCSSKL